jgi:hypothetical protein
VSPQTLAISAAAVLLVTTLASVALAGKDFGGGVAATGGLMLVNLLLWTFTVKGLLAATLSGRPPILAVIVYTLKLLLLTGGLALLCATFPPLSVVLGASVVVTAIMANAAVGHGFALSAGEA